MFIYAAVGAYLRMRNFSVVSILVTLFLEEFDYAGRVQHVLQLSGSSIGQYFTMWFNLSFLLIF